MWRAARLLFPSECAHDEIGGSEATEQDCNQTPESASLLLFFFFFWHLFSVNSTPVVGFKSTTPKSLADNLSPMLCQLNQQAPQPHSSLIQLLQINLLPLIIMPQRSGKQAGRRFEMAFSTSLPPSRYQDHL